jgi:hypothetical protein
LSRAARSEGIEQHICLQNSADDRVEWRDDAHDLHVNGLAHFIFIVAAIRAKPLGLGIAIPDAGESKPRKRPGCGGLDTMTNICAIAPLAKNTPIARKRGRNLRTTFSEIGSSAFAHKSLKRKTRGIQ